MRLFWWHSLKADVTRFCTHCDACQRNKPQNIAPASPLQPLPIPGTPWASVSVDFIVQLPKTNEGHDAICVFVDRLTKMVHLVPCTSNIDAEGTARLFIDHVWKLHGIPSTFVSDRGSVCTSKFFACLCQELNINQLLSTAYHPQTDGQTERVNRVLEDTLRHFVSPLQDDWHRLLSAVEFAINNAKHESHRMTPFFMNYGYHPATPLSLLAPRRAQQRAGLVSQNPAALRVRERLQEALNAAKLALQAARQRQKAYADLHRSPVQIAVGDMVLLSSKHINLKNPGSRKLLPRWLGPFKVVRQINNVAFALQLPDSMQAVHSVFHASLLKPYRADGPVQPPPPIVLEDGDILWRVESLLDQRIARRRGRRFVEYLVKWDGFGHEHNTWEPESHIADPTLIADFRAAQSTRVQASRDRTAAIAVRRKAKAKRHRAPAT